MVGEFTLNFTEQNVVTVNGNEVNTTFGTIRLNPGLNELEIRVNSF
jgi:hypothetical protein